LFSPLVFGIHLFHLQGDQVVKFKKSVRFYSSTRNNEPDGWFCGYPFAGWFAGADYMTIITTKRFYDLINVQEKAAPPPPGVPPPPTVKFFEQESYGWYAREIDLPDLKARPGQAEAVHQIITDFQTHGHSTVLLSGKPNLGKTMVSLLVCRQLIDSKIAPQVSLCDSWDPSGHNRFASLLAYTRPSARCPFVVVLDEVDELMMGFHDKNCRGGGYISGKSDWNRFFDRFDRKLYPFVILIMTTNKPISWFDELDPAYMRPGRVNVKIQLD
jgi:hypothetical protein